MNLPLLPLFVVMTALLPHTVHGGEPDKLRSTAGSKTKPNIILIFTDDQGYADVGCYGGKGFKTPHLDRMAAEGMRFTSFYSGCPVCSGSRAAILTGRHYQRVGVPPVMFPGNKNGLNPNEITIAALLKNLGYITAIVGKWHLGHLPMFLPTRHGFDSYFGIPYSNDMALDPTSARFAKGCVFREGMDEKEALAAKPKNGKVPLMRGEEIIEYPVDQATLTRRYTEEAISFIHKNKEKPFFLYLAHAMPHVPLHVSEKFKGRTKTLFGDVIEEVDWSVGEVLKAVKDAGIDDKTLVVFTTDNGAHQGSALPLRGKKATMYEGGVRVPCIVRWPGMAPAKSECDEIAATVDMLPTFAALAGGKAPGDRPLDGKDIRPLIFAEKGAKTPHEYYMLAHGGGAVRKGDWKYYPWPEGKGKKDKKDEKPAGKKVPPVQLYDLRKDLSETTNVAQMHPDVVKLLHTAYEAFLEDLERNKLPGADMKKKKAKAAEDRLALARRPLLFDVLLQERALGEKEKGPQGLLWKRHTIDNTSIGADGVRPFDVNGDGLADLVVGWEEGSQIRVYLNPGPAKAQHSWPKVTVGKVASPEDAVFADLDGDGAVDVVSCCEGKTKSVFVHWAPREKEKYLDPAAWKTEAIPAVEGLCQWMFCMPMQIDGKNGVDLLIGGKNKGAWIGWLESPREPRNLKDWKWHPLKEAGWIMTLDAADMDEDGDLDVLVSDRRGPGRGVFWLENPGEYKKQTSPWPVHEIGSQKQEVMFVDLADLDGDGLRDVIVPTVDRRLFVHLRKDRKKNLWHSYDIDFPGGVASGKAVRVLDIDEDGKKDILLSCGNGEPGHILSYLSYRKSTADRFWDCKAISGHSGKKGGKPDLMVLLDLDGDGDADVITTEERSQLGVVWYENPKRNGK